MSIEYCLANVDPASRRRLRARPDAREAGCLEQCGRCDAGPFLVVDGTVVDGEAIGGGHEAILAAAGDR